MRVLVIDESVKHFAPIADSLREKGVDVIVAPKGKDVPSLLSETEPDLVVIDRHQPSPSEEVMRAVRDSGWDRPVIVLSGRALSRYEGFSFVKRSLGVEEVVSRILTAATVGSLMKGVKRICKNLERCYAS